jgi:hypothetical protein
MGKKDVISLIVDLEKKIDTKGNTQINKSVDELESLMNDNANTKADIKKAWERFIPIQNQLTDLNSVQNKCRAKDSLINVDIFNTIKMMQQKAYVLSEDTEQYNIGINVADWLKLLKIGHKYTFEGFCQSYKKYFIDYKTFEKSEYTYVYTLISENIDSTKLNHDATKFKTITTMERLTDKIFKFNFTDGSSLTNIVEDLNEDEENRYGPIIFKGKDENSNVEIKFSYYPYLGLCANGMRLILK